jgi:hypothetical protein
MSQILRDPLWQFVGAALSLVAIAISIVLFFRQRQRKSLAYRILTDAAVLTVGEELRGKLVVSYEGMRVRNVQLLLLKIVNLGNLPIASADFEQPLSIRFGTTAKILSSEILNSAPEELHPNISLLNDELVLEPLLLNPNDHITIKCLVSEHDGKVHVSGRIIGVPKIVQAKESFINQPAFFLGIISGLIGSAAAMGVIKGQPRHPLFYALLAVAVGVALVFFFRGRRKLKQNSRANQADGRE